MNDKALIKVLRDMALQYDEKSRMMLRQAQISVDVDYIASLLPSAIRCQAKYDAIQEVAEKLGISSLEESREEGNQIKEEDLIYAASSRCPCGAGLAYKHGVGINGRWDCSDILLGTAKQGIEHIGGLSFRFYEIKSERQPSANGATTRPKRDE